MSPNQQFWCGACFIGSFVAYLAIHFLSMKQLTRLMGQHISNRQFSVVTSSENQRKACRVGKIMSAVSEHVPWDCKCLAQALSVRWLLNWQQIPSVIYLGARIDSDNRGKMMAHAWVTVGGITVIGGEAFDRYGVVASFVTMPEKI